MSARGVRRQVRLPLDGPLLLSELPRLRAGDTVWLARQSHPRHGTWIEAALTPYRTNQGRQELERGYLGTTNDLTEFALGRAVIVAVGNERRDGHDAVRGLEIPPYLSLSVRMDDSAPETFELAGRNEYGDPRPVRINSDEMILAHPDEYPAYVVAGLVATLKEPT